MVASASKRANNCAVQLNCSDEAKPVCAVLERGFGTFTNKCKFENANCYLPYGLRKYKHNLF